MANSCIAVNVRCHRRGLHDQIQNVGNYQSATRGAEWCQARDILKRSGCHRAISPMTCYWHKVRKASDFGRNGSDVGRMFVLLCRIFNWSKSCDTIAGHCPGSNHASVSDCCVNHLIQQASNVHCAAGRAIGDLMTTRGAIRNNNGRFRSRLKRGEQIQICHLK